jgi:hypothetical protein
MIAKRIIRKTGASDFARLGRYILNDGLTDVQALTERTVAYILDGKGDQNRVGAIRITNCHGETPALAIKEIMATQAMNTRAQGDRTYHLVVSFAAGEKPSQEQFADIKETLCATIGLGAHQRLSAVHRDTSHLHIHVAINKIHPESFRLVEPYFDQRKLMAACEALEQKHGLIRTQHGASQSHAVHQNGRLAVLRDERERFQNVLRDLIKSGFESRIEQVADWAALHAFFSEAGLEARLRGAGLVISRQGGGLSIKASAVHPALSLPALIARLGPFIPAAQLRPHSSASAADNEALEAIKASYKKRADAICQSKTLSAVGKRAAYRDLNKLRLAAYARLKAEQKSGSAGDQLILREPVERKPADSAGASAAIRSYVAERNSLRAKVSDIVYHALWTPVDAGPVVYQGRRKLSGSWALLFLKGETMLVKAVSDFEAHAARLWPVGKPVSIDAVGRVSSKARRRR